jgi:hypothetical protein
MNENIGKNLAGTLTPRQDKNMSIQLVKNGYILNPSWPGKPAIAKTLNEMLDEVREFFEYKPEQE